MQRITNEKAKQTNLYTVAEAAKYLMVSTRFMYTLFHNEQLIPTHKTAGNILLYSRRQLDTLQKKRAKNGRRGRPYNPKGCMA